MFTGRLITESVPALVSVGQEEEERSGVLS